MKLNLVPTYVSRESKAAPAIIGGVLLFALGALAAAFMVSTSSAALAEAQSKNRDAQAAAANAKSISDEADTIMGKPEVHDIARNTQLYQAMTAHCDTYPKLYNMVRQYVPGYFRLTRMSAAPGDDTHCVVTLTGVVTTYQQYADLGLALLRMPGAQNYSPSGFTLRDPYVPSLTPEDMTGRPIHPGEQNIPDDPQARFNRMLSQGKLTGYLGIGYGQDVDAPKGPMPDASQVTVVVTLQSDPKKHFDANLMTPNPRATLAASAGGGETGGAGTGANAPAGGAAAGFGGPPPAATGGGAPAAPPTGKSKGKAKDDDE